MGAADPDAELTDADFARFSALIHERSGIYLHGDKKTLLRTRLLKRMRKLNLTRFRDYYERVVNDRNGEEMDAMLDAISTNVTSFFREKQHFDFLARVLPELADNDRGYLNIWSAACSSGEEPYTLAMTVAETLPDWRRLGVRILATDIAESVLAKAAAGMYPRNRLEGVPPQLLPKYFSRNAGSDTVQVSQELRYMIRFRHFNLNQDHWPFSKCFGVIFCRNVMIYFNRETQEQLIGRFARVMCPGGYLMVGHSESLTGIKHPLTYADATIYRK